MSFTTTAIYAGINVLFLLFLGSIVVRRRWATRTSVGDGGHKVMMKAVRAHGNNAENLPTAILIMALLEGLGAPLALVHGLGIALTVGRFSHASGLFKTLGPSKRRIFGMILTWSVFLIGGLACIYYGATGR